MKRKRQHGRPRIEARLRRRRPPHRATTPTDEKAWQRPAGWPQRPGGYRRASRPCAISLNPSVSISARMPSGRPAAAPPLACSHLSTLSEPLGRARARLAGSACGSRCATSKVISVASKGICHRSLWSRRASSSHSCRTRTHPARLASGIRWRPACCNSRFSGRSSDSALSSSPRGN